MGRKSLAEKEELSLKLYRNPDLVERDTVAMSAMFWQRHLAIKSETRKWSLLQQLLFIIVLGSLKDWRIGGNDNVITLNNNNVMQELGWKLNKKNFRKMGDILRTEFSEMVENSAIRLQDANSKLWITENLLIGAEGDSKFTRVTINPKFMNHFEDLFYLGTNCGQSFHAILEPDITVFKSKYSYFLFADLRVRSQIKKRPVEFTVRYSIEDLKRLLEIDSNEYVRKDKETGKKLKFDYPSFEKRVLLPAIEEINGTEQIKILPCESGKFYEKEKSDRKVNAYVFRVLVKDFDTIKNERLQLQEAAKKAGLNPIFYPDLKETFDVLPNDWQGKWRTFEQDNRNQRIDDKTTSSKRYDKLAKDTKALFEIPKELVDKK